jgi:tRNA A-37 threonylcarbamoyl transferase component Bud32
LIIRKPVARLSCVPNNQMDKYKLSKHIAIAPVTNSYEVAVPKEFIQDHYSLKNEVRDKEFLINSTVKYFIDKFSSPKSLKELVKEVRSDLKNDEAPIKTTCSSFLKFLIKKDILVHEHDEEEILLATPLFNPGDTFDNFRIETLLSDRGLIEIYLAADLMTGSESVVKALNKGKTEDSETFAEELNELQREYKMLKSVEHIPVICKAFDYKLCEEYAYINLEYIKGISLLKFLSANSPGEKDRLAIIKTFVSGFAALHSTGLIHGDIHSSNIIVAHVNELKIIDLGYSRKVQVDQDEVTSFGGVMHYMPPERIKRTKTRQYTREADLYSDVYQVGILMYLMLYNDLPFDGFIWEELSRKIKDTEPVFPSTSFAGYTVSPDLINIVKKCLNKKPAKRYKNAGEINEDLKLL